MLHALSARTPVQQRVAIVVAHPDDETIAAGGSLHLLPDALLIHVTDGAPQRLDDAARAGFSTPAAYAEAREAELQAALALVEVTPRRARLGIADQDASLHMPGIARLLQTLFAQHRIEAVLTHAYEGGHPDHDATAWAVHKAARHWSLPVWEFPAYHAAHGERMVVQRFIADDAGSPVHLPAAQAARKRAMFDCFHTQRDILRLFDPALEWFRAAPEYDFTAAPHAGPLNYERWGWDLTGQGWRTLAAKAADRQACAA